MATPGGGSTTVFRGSLPVVSMSTYSQCRVSDPCFALVGVLLPKTPKICEIIALNP